VPGNGNKGGFLTDSGRRGVLRVSRVVDERESTSRSNESSSGIIEQFKRRNVTRVGLAYLAVSWFVLQVLETLVSLGVLQESIGRYAFFALLIGFPVAILLSWKYEFTSDGIKSASDVGVLVKTTPFGGRRIDLLIIGSLSLVIVLLVLDNYVLDKGAGIGSEPISIAVLPFKNMSDEVGQDSFSDGLTEELLNSLASSKDLKVISRTSSFTFKNSDLSLTEIATRLGARHILEGSVRKAGNTIRDTAQLIDATSDTHLWSDTYDRELSVDNILRIQEEVAVTVANALHARIRPLDIADRRTRDPANLQALNSYRDGMVHLRLIETGRGNRDTYSAAINFFEAAIVADPEWVQPTAALGSVYHFRMDHGYRSEDRRLSTQYIKKALELDDQYGPAWVSLAYLNHMAGDFSGAEYAYNRVRELGHKAPWAFAIFNSSIGRHEEAIANFVEAAELDPLSIPIKFQLAQEYTCAERYDEAIAGFERALSMLPDPQPTFRLAYSYAKVGERQKAIQIAEEFERVHGVKDGPHTIVYAVAGMPERARAGLTEEALREFDRVVMAQLAIAVGEVEIALNLLEEQAKDEVPFGLLFMRCSEEIRSLSGNPRYERILDQVGFPD
jgi:TolB-like protein/tetratricopeptide (TPR) repeat protein